MPNLGELIATAEQLWPLDLAEDWDAPGLVTGNASTVVSKVMLSVDVTSEVVDCAVDAGAEVLIAHHPYLMKGVTTLSEATVKGSVIAKAIRAGLAIYAAHTNADSATDGVSDAIAAALGLGSVSPLSTITATTGLGRVGTLPEVVTLGELATRIARVLPHTASGVRVAGNYNQPVERIAVCGGAGDSLIAAAIASDVDVYVTSDLRHHPVQDARELALLKGGRPALIDISHWAGEYIWLESAAARLRTIYPEVVFEVCDLRTDPWDFVVTQ